MTETRNVAHECSLCSTYLPTIGHLESEYAALKTRVAGRFLTAQEWDDLFAIEAALRAKGVLKGSTYNED
jgi:hypothetical protein